MDEDFCLSPAQERQVDRLLAIHLFGWAQHPDGRWAPPHATPGSLLPAMPLWSTTWVGAGQVVHAMQDQGHAMGLEERNACVHAALSAGPGAPPRRHWVAWFEKETRASVVAHSAPCAVALAALRALGVDASNFDATWDVLDGVPVERPQSSKA